VAVLALGGIGLVAAGVAILGNNGTSRYLDQRAQNERVLAAPQVPTVPTTPSPDRPMTPVATHVIRAQMPRPVRVLIPAIGVSAPIIRLGLNPDRTIQVPANYLEAGWFEPGPEPGEPGAALIVGHVDSYKGPGVFFRLRALRRGDRITVIAADGRRLRFVVTSSRDLSKQHFPSNLVYARTPRPTLRLITCGGRFNSATGHYLNNHIVFAWLER
jgi:sortase (surface protein transpeptidase)